MSVETLEKGYLSNNIQNEDLPISLSVCFAQIYKDITF